MLLFSGVWQKDHTLGLCIQLQCKSRSGMYSSNCIDMCFVQHPSTSSVTASKSAITSLTTPSKPENKPLMMTSPKSAFTSAVYALHKRQGDQMNTCIEAKCAGLENPHYAECIFQECLTGVKSVMVTRKSGRKRLSLSPRSRSPSSPGPCPVDYCANFSHRFSAYVSCIVKYCKTVKQNRY